MGAPAALASLALLAGVALAPAPAAGFARARSARAAGAMAALQDLRRRNAITQSAYGKYATAYIASKRSLGRLHGTRAVELGAVLANVQAIAAAGAFTPSRLPALFLTLERNRQWWTNQPLLSSGARVSFPGSRIVWEYYAGQGIEIQWLGTFGSANGYYLSGHENSNLRQLLGEVLPLGTRRAGGIAWEYLFNFGGGRPPWTSGLSQGTAVQVLARAWSRLHDPAYLTAAQQALGIFRMPPPQGVRVRRGAGVHYAEYSYAPGDRILNGFIQALVGLYDYTSLTNDPRGLALFEAGDAQARVEVPHYDTGSWSRYDQFSESTLNYHELLAEFLAHLCQRTRKGSPLPAGSPPSQPPSGPPAGGTTTTGTPTTGTQTTGTPTTGTPTTGTPPAPRPAPIAGDAVYCATAQRFEEDLRTPPSVTLLTSAVGRGTRAGVQISLSKVSTVRMTIRQGGRVVWRNSAIVEGGRPRLLWITPSGSGSFSVNLTATDPAGNFSSTNGTIVVR
jgi:hypothetical protein